MGRRKGYNSYTKTYLEDMVNDSPTFADLCRRLGIRHGGSQAYVKSRLKAFAIDISHYRHGCGWSKGISNTNRKRKIESIFIVLPNGSSRMKRKHLRRAMIDSGMIEQCAICGIPPEWRGKELVLTVDHIDGNWLDCRRLNLRFLCPNCDSQTPTYKNSTRKYFGDLKIVHTSIHDVMNDRVGRVGECGNTSSPENCQGLIT